MLVSGPALSTTNNNFGMTIRRRLHLSASLFRVKTGSALVEHKISVAKTRHLRVKEYYA